MKKAAFKISFMEPQIKQQQEQQGCQQGQQQEEEHQKGINIRWNTINNSKRKWVRKKDFTAASSGAVDNGRASAEASISRIIDVKIKLCRALCRSFARGSAILKLYTEDSKEGRKTAAT